MARYDYDRGYRGTPRSFSGWYPGAFWAGMPMYGWGAWDWMPFPEPFAHPVRPPAGYPPRRPPRESPTYGRGGDEAARRWAESRGYDAGYDIPPRPPRRGPRYGDGWR